MKKEEEKKTPTKKKQTTKKIVNKKEKKEEILKPTVEEPIVEENSCKTCSKTKKRTIITILVLLLLIALFLLWWFNRKFDVVFKYNNGDADTKIQVKYLHYIDENDVRKDLSNKNSNFLGYFETYELKEEDVKKVKEDKELEKTICKKDFKLNKDKTKCVSEFEFDFPNTKIKKDTTIEAFWSSISFTINPTKKTILEGGYFTITAKVSGAKDKTVKWSSNNSKIATVNSKGKVTGVKAGTATIIAESNGIKRKCVVTVKKEQDKGRISLATSKKCVIGSSSVTVTATVTNAKDSTVTWSSDSCLKLSGSGNTRTVIANNCSSNPKVTAKLSNGQSASVTLNYEPTLVVKVYDNGSEIHPDSNGYWGNRITVKTNTAAKFTASHQPYVTSTTSTSLTLSRDSGTTITIKTDCGQSKTIKITPIIN